MKTQLTYNAGYLHISTPGVSDFEIPMLNERDANLIIGICEVIYLEGKQEGADEVAALSKRCIDDFMRKAGAP